MEQFKFQFMDSQELWSPVTQKVGYNLVGLVIRQMGNKIITFEQQLIVGGAGNFMHRLDGRVCRKLEEMLDF
jgi:hypothetical protein